MKKRIAAMLLAAVMVFNIIGDNARPARAVAPAVAAAIPSFVAVVYGVMTGCFDECAEALGYCLQAAADGVEVTADFLGDCFVGDEDTPSWFVTGWCQISNTVTSWFDSGELELDEDGKIYMNYYQYLDLCNQMYDYVDISMDLGSSISHKFIASSFEIPLKVEDLPTFGTKTSYSPIFYSDSAIYICRTYSYMFENISYPTFFAVNYKGGPVYNSPVSDATCDVFGYSLDNILYHQRLNTAGQTVLNEYTVDTWYCYDFTSGELTTCNYDSVDTSLDRGYIAIAGTFYDFVGTISSMTAAPDTSAIDDLSDPLDDVLVLNPNPGLVVDTDPSITDPRDAVLITDIPAVDDMTLTQAMEDAKPRLDMEVPSSILNKFPFSLPFDFYRLLTIFAAEPKAPVFRIPISNVNVDMSAFEGNQTLGQFASGETTELMFEIDEEIVIDLSNIPYIQPISHAIFIVSFIALLIFITTKLIHH